MASDASGDDIGRYEEYANEVEDPTKHTKRVLREERIQDLRKIASAIGVSTEGDVTELSERLAKAGVFPGRADSGKMYRHKEGESQPIAKWSRYSGSWSVRSDPDYSGGEPDAE